MSALFQITLQIISLAVIFRCGVFIPLAFYKLSYRTPPPVDVAIGLAFDMVTVSFIYIAVTVAFFFIGMFLTIWTSPAKDGHIDIAERSMGPTLLRLWCSQNILLAIVSLASFAYLALSR